MEKPRGIKIETGQGVSLDSSMGPGGGLSEGVARKGLKGDTDQEIQDPDLIRNWGLILKIICSH